MSPDPRTERLAESLTAVRARIARACDAARRDPAEVRLLAVTKRFPSADVARLIDLGVRDFAENKDQEAARKVREVAELRPGAPVRWHMVGRLQRNKARSVARWAHEVQSVDSDRLADALDNAVASARENGDRTTPLDVLVQVSLDADPARGGCPPDGVPRLVDRVARSRDLRLRGLMTIAPLSDDDDASFARLEELFRRLRSDRPELAEMSAGMSGDLEYAIAHGSTCVRVGTALLGDRELASHQ